MMQMATDEVVDVVAVGDGFVTAFRTVLVGRIVAAARVAWRAGRGVLRIDRDGAFVDVTVVNVMKMAVVEVVGVTVVAHPRVPAAGAVLVDVVFVGGMVAHWNSSRAGWFAGIEPSLHEPMK